MKSKFCLISVLLLCMWLPSAAQYYSRSNIKKKISEWGALPECGHHDEGVERCAERH